MTTEAEALSRPPIFLIGAPRSGTTLLRLMLDSHPNISAGPETNFLTYFEPIVGEHWPRLQLYGLSQTDWYARIGGFFDAFQMEYAQRRGKRRWAEKTPAYTLHLEFINALFPDSQMIHIIRDGRDVVNSHLNRWGYRRAWRSVRKWPEYVALGREFGRKYPARYHELRYEALIDQPELTIRPILTFLQEPWDDAVLNFPGQPHDKQARYDQFTQSQRAKGGETDLIYRSRSGSWRRELPLSLRLACRLRQATLLRELGYAV